MFPLKKSLLNIVHLYLMLINHILINLILLIAIQNRDQNSNYRLSATSSTEQHS